MASATFEVGQRNIGLVLAQIETLPRPDFDKTSLTSRSAAEKILNTLSRRDRSPDSRGLDRGAFWKHSLAVGCASRRVALGLGCPVDPDEAFFLGLFHDLGKAA